MKDEEERTPRAKIIRWQFGPKLSRAERDNLFATDPTRAWDHASCLVNSYDCGRDDCPMARNPPEGTRTEDP